MCGICGWVDGRDPPDAPMALLRRMHATLAHRGPDGEGAWSSGDGVWLGHRRLAVIDPTPSGLQPMHHQRGEERLTAVLNGEIYNYRALRTKLQRRRRRFGSGSDTEVLLQGIAEWGPVGFLERSSGMYAFAVWDHAAKRLWLARDRMGEKPLYWAHLADGTLVFGSELRAVRSHPGVRTGVDATALRKLLAYDYVPAPMSIIEGVHKLEAGHLLCWEAGRIVRHERWWDIPAPAQTLDRPREAARTLWEGIRTGVRSCLVSDVPVGIFLSGGLDSTAVATAAAELRDPAELDTFGVGFDDPSFDESTHAQTVATHLGTRHHTTRLTADGLLDLLPTILRGLDEPLADPSLVPTHLLARFTRERVTVALGGDGGDELLLGYPTFGAHALAKAAARVPGPLRRRVLRPAVRALPVSTRNWSFDYRLKRFVDGLDYGPLARHFVWIGGTAPRDHVALLEPAVFAAAAPDPLDDVARLLSGRAKRPSDLDTLSALYARLYLSEGVLQKVDRATMAHGLEGRAPLLNEAVVTTCARIPPHLKLRGRETKWILRKALFGKVPDAILRRPKKGFGIPLTAWLKGPLLPLCRELLSPDALRRHALFKPETAEQLIREHTAGWRDHRKTLWTLMVFQLWAGGA